MMRRLGIAVVTAVAVAAAVTPTGVAQQVGGRRHRVTIQGLRFTPADVVAAPGDTVVWVNRDLVPHTVTAKDKSLASPSESQGIAIDDKVSHDAAVLRNWEFFRAPLAGIVCMHRDLGLADALSVGMFLQTLLLALTERGLGTCVEVSIAGYPEIVREQLEIPAQLTILCGLAVGYPDPNFSGNRLHVSRDSIEKNMVFLDR